MELTVTPVSQAIFPFGEQDSLVITNNGPWTIYVDSDSSISEANSHAIPPTGVMVWDSERPLWMVCASIAGSGNGSRVTITRNTQGSLFVNSSELILKEFVGDTGSNPIDTSFLECSAFAYVSVGFFSVAMTYNYLDIMGAAKTYSGAINWYDSGKNFLFSETFILPGFYGFDNSIDMWSRATFKVKGAYFSIVANTLLGSVKKVKVRVTGTTRVMREGMTFSRSAVPFAWLPDLQGSLNYTITGNSITADATALTGSANIYFPALWPKAHITVRSNGTVANGIMALRNALDNNIYFSTAVAIPFGSGAVTEMDVHVPLFEPSILIVTLTTANTLFNIHATFED